MKTVFFAAAMAAASLAAATPAAAAVYTVTWKGKVTSGADDGYFGVGGDLTGYDYTAVYTVDTATPGAYLYDDDNYSYVHSWGPANPLTAKITINGATFNIGEYYGYSDELMNYGNGTLDRVYQYTTDYAQISNYDNDGNYLGYDYRSHQLHNYVQSDVNVLSDANIHTIPNSHVVNQDDYAYGWLYMYDYTYDQAAGNYTYSRYINLSLDVQSMNVSGGVPEPASWALMILGFGGAGAALRRRRLLAA